MSDPQPDPWAELRAALAAGPTPGPWTLTIGTERGDYGSILGQYVDGVDSADGRVAGFCDDYGTDAGINGRYIVAASPDRVAGLLAERDRLREALSDVGYIVWGPDRGFPQPKDRAGADGIVWTSPEAVRELLATDALDTGEARRE